MGSDEGSSGKYFGSLSCYAGITCDSAGDYSFDSTASTTLSDSDSFIDLTLCEESGACLFIPLCAIGS